MPGILYLVATPIGNLADITLRALETLKSVSLILAEDTRVTKKLLTHYRINTKVTSYHQHSPDSKKYEVLNLLLQGQALALVTDAGTPGLSDPGNELIDFLTANCAEYRHAERLAAPKGPTKERGPDITQGFAIIPIPGPSALTAAVSVSGFNTNQFTFMGYFPKKKKLKFCRQIVQSQIPAIYFDSPHRLIKNLEYLLEQVGDREIVVARELTKLHETIYRGNISEVILILQTTTLKGELTVIVNTD